MVSLSEQYNKSKLKNTVTDPEEWIVYLEILQTRLAGMSYDITDRHLMIHIMHNLPPEYDSVVEDLEKSLDHPSTPLTIETVRYRLHAKWERMNR